MTMTVLVTGAAGFVGRQVLDALGARASSIRAVVREGKQWQLPPTVRVDRVVTTPDLFAECADWWEEVCRGVDTVVHVAWYAEPGEYLQSGKNLDCLVGTLHLAQGAARARVKRFVGIGTCLEYDTSEGYLSVETALKPRTPYAAAKAAAYTSLAQWLPRQGIEFAWCRLFYLYGDHEDPRRLTPYLRTRLARGESAELTNGKQVRDFLDVHQAGRLIADRALSSDVGAFNICSGIAVTVRQFAERIADEYGRRDLLRFGARPDNPDEPPCVVGIN